jgi:hypothetical protein
MIVIQTWRFDSEYFFIVNALNNCQTNSVFINNTIWYAWLYQLVKLQVLFENRSEKNIFSEVWCAYIGRQTPCSSKRILHFEIRTCLGKNKNLGHGSSGDWSESKQQINRPSDCELVQLGNQSRIDSWSWKLVVGSHSSPGANSWRKY